MPVRTKQLERNGLFRLVNCALMLLPLVSFVPSSAHAQQGIEECSIGVRVVAASLTSSANTTPGPAEQIALKDIAGQLKQLPFASYRTVDYVEKKLRLNQRSKFIVQGVEADEHYMVAVVPHEIAAGRVQLTVEWHGVDGESLVSTRMRVINGKNIVLGADGNGQESSIVCVGVSCAPRASTLIR